MILIWFGIISIVVLSIARLFDEVVWIKRGKPKRKKNIGDYLTDGDYD